MTEAETIAERIRAALGDTHLRQAVRFTTDRLRTMKKASVDALGNFEAWRERGEAIRAHTIAHLDYYVAQFADAAEAAGAHVHFARDAAEVGHIVREIVRQSGARAAVKSKSMVSEEIELNVLLEAAGVRVVETDLGEYIIQLAGERPSHIIMPSIHKTREAIAALFQHAGMEAYSTETNDLTRFARETLRAEFLTAELGISGCNFAIAESGTVVLFTNEGNGRMVTTWPKTHIVLMGMERIIPTWDDLDVMAHLLPRSGTGQALTVYMTALTGPRRSGESDGPEAMHIVIVDNGRSNDLGDPHFQPVLHCIRCGACLNVCPVYRQIGGHAYGSVYPGPIGAVLTPVLDPARREAYELAYASSLCGACYEACPVRIPLHDMLVRLRVRAVARGYAPPAERRAFRLYAAAARDGRRFRLALRTIRAMQRLTVQDGRRLPKLFRLIAPLQAWVKGRRLPYEPGPTFRELWVTRRRDGDHRRDDGEGKGERP